jgi:hypothetical protein
VFAGANPPATRKIDFLGTTSIVAIDCTERHRTDPARFEPVQNHP